ncbi:hypothetical protein [Dokdonella sp.]|uniref:hypothetical protein n=1 Tax=Dokdonella sp. TaxID=2291710 RepID=UPI001B0E6B3B|nr:hypothetical protein [Dokdonella sp.]MBO9663109.1 hypothetical protein [Dokdonella sp.]
MSAASYRSRVFASLALCLAPGLAGADVVCMPEQNIDVPQTGEGVYVNLMTGQHAGAESLVPGFDFDPYAAQNSDPADQLKFYWGSSSNGGAGVASAGDTYAVLAPGDIIGATSLFTRAGFTGDTSAWQAGVADGYLGVRFKNETTTLINYGWIHFSTTAPLGFPATILDWCYEDGGGEIEIPAVPSDTIFCDGFDELACPATDAAP